MQSSLCLTQTSHLSSEKFGFISSEGLVKDMAKHGLELDKVVESKIRKNKEIRQGFQKHRMLFNTGMKTNDGHLQFLVTNSHEGSSALRFQLGFYRFVCSNGLVIGETVFEPISIRHTFDNVSRINDVVSMVLDQKNKVFESIDELKSKRLNREQLEKFEQDALSIRGYSSNYTGLLVPDFTIKRYDDKSDDVFTVMNVVQENILRTGFKARKEDGSQVTLRAIKSIDEQNRINSGLWDLAMAA